MSLEDKYTLGASISGVYGFEKKAKIPLPFFVCGVSAGFPSPADDYIGQQLDLNDLLIRNPAATFFVRVAGDSMTGVGINDHDGIGPSKTLATVAAGIAKKNPVYGGAFDLTDHKQIDQLLAACDVEDVWGIGR